MCTAIFACTNTIAIENGLTIARMRGARFACFSVINYLCKRRRENQLALFACFLPLQLRLPPRVLSWLLYVCLFLCFFFCTVTLVYLQVSFRLFEGFSACVFVNRRRFAAESSGFREERWHFEASILICLLEPGSGVV